MKYKNKEQIFRLVVEIKLNYVGDPKSKVSNFFRNRKKHIFSIIDTSF